MNTGPTIQTQITAHTLWQAITGQTPPLALAPWPIPHATLDSRAVSAGDLFVALAGPNTDGHQYIGAALANGAKAILCEERGQASAREHAAVIIDCTAGRWQSTVSLSADFTAQSALVYVVDNSLHALQKVGAFQRLHRCRPELRVTGVTGSVGKTSTKEVAAAVLRQRYCTLHSPGNLNGEQGLPLALLALGPEYERAVLEMGMYGLGEIYTQCELARPQIGIVTNVGPVHLSRLGTIERIAQAKAELVQALPSAADGGVALLNWDDERVKAMAPLTSAQIFRYGLTPDADLWADQIESAGLEGIHFRFHHRQADHKVETLYARIPLLGRHSVHTALRAAALGLVEGLSWEEIIAGLQSLPGQLRLVVVPGINGATVIDDTYNASPASTVAALNLLQDLEPKTGGRRIAVLGDMRELGDHTDEGHKLVGRRAVEVVDLLVTIGELGGKIAAEALAVGFTSHQVYRLANDKEAVDFLQEALRPTDLILVKGSRAVGMDTIVSQITVK